ncbi:MAG TPA: hypothetical protein VHX52_02880 [Steroidobacteraceae bacterium]|jgi:hypothetical protein|nr:hypothetical protein [Steroidobacteraceae bacterium]
MTDDAQTETALHLIEVTVRMQQLVAVKYAEGPDQHVDRFANGEAAFPKFPVIVGSRKGDILADEVDAWKLGQQNTATPVIGIARETPQKFRKNQVSSEDSAAGEQFVELLYLCGIDAVEKIDPYRCVDEHHGGSAGAAH